MSNLSSTKCTQFLADLINPFRLLFDHPWPALLFKNFPAIISYTKGYDVFCGLLKILRTFKLT